MALTSGEKKLLAVCALALAIPLGVAAFFGHINATPTVATSPIAPAPKPNGYNLYVQASNAITPANPPVDAILDTKPLTDPKLRAQRYSLKRKDAWLAQNQKGFALFEQAQKATSLAPPHYQGGINSPSAAHRQMARYKAIESNAHWQRGDHHAALQSGLDILQMSHDIQRGGGMMDYLVGAAIGGISHRATGDTVDHLDAKQAKAAAKRVEKLLETRWTLRATLINDQKQRQQDWLATMKNPNWRTAFLEQRKWSSANWGAWAPPPPTWEEHWLIYTTSKRQIIADLDALYEHAISEADLPYAIEKQPPLARNSAFASYIAPNSGVRFNRARALAADRVLMLRLALRAFQLEHGAPPPNLKSLVPTYIKSVPADPFGRGEPLRYKTDSQTYTLWSIGPDGIDDDGTPIPWRRKAPKRYADEREKLPFANDDLKGDTVAGKNS